MVDFQLQSEFEYCLCGLLSYSKFGSENCFEKKKSTIRVPIKMRKIGSNLLALVEFDSRV